MADKDRQPPGGLDDDPGTRDDGGREAGSTRFDGGRARDRDADGTRFDGDRGGPPDDATRFDGNGRRPSSGPEPADRRDPTDQRDRTAAPGDPRLPGPLRARFEVRDEPAGEGAEGSVYLVYDRQAGEERILKIYNRGIELDRDTVDVLLDLRRDPEGRRHVVQLHEARKVEGRWYELQEHCAGGSLRAPTGPWSVSTAQLVEQVGQALAYVQGRLVFRDVKPSNLLLRTSGTEDTGTVDIVLGDFGSARSVTDFSVQYAGWAGTAPYLPPEAFRYVVTPGWDWWSFGMVVAEHAMGQHPLAYDDGTLPDLFQVPTLVTDDAVDVSGIADDRLRRLCQGLLIRDYQRRWRAEEFRRWRAGEDPPLPSDDPQLSAGQDPADDTTAAAEPTSRVQFAGGTYTDPDELALAFQEQWRYTLDRLVMDRNPEWIAGLETFLRDRQMLGAAQTVGYLGPATPNPSKALAGLLLDMSQDIDPIFDRMSLTPEGLRDAADDVLVGRLTSSRLEAVRQAGVLDLWRVVPGIADGQRISRPWDDGAGHIEQLMAETARQGFEIHRAAGDRAKAWVLLSLLGDGYRVQLDEALAEARQTPANETGWWTALAAEGATAPAAAALAVVTAPQAALLAADLDARDELSEQEDRAEELFEAELEQLRDGDAETLDGLGRRRWPGLLGRGRLLRRPRRYWSDRQFRRRRGRGRSSRPGLLALALGGALVGFHTYLITAYQAPMQDYFERRDGASMVDDPLGTLDLLTRNVGIFVAIVGIHAVMVVVNRRAGTTIRLGRPSIGGWARAVGVRLTQLALISAVVVSGLVDLLLGDAASGYPAEGFPDGFLPDEARVLGGVFVVVAAWSALALVRTVIDLARNVIDPYP